MSAQLVPVLTLCLHELEVSLWLCHKYLQLDCMEDLADSVELLHFMIATLTLCLHELVSLGWSTLCPHELAEGPDKKIGFYP